MARQLPRSAARWAAMSRKNMVERADAAIAEAAAPARRHPAVRFAGTVAEIADQPQMIALCSAVLSAGLVGGNQRLARTGGRMLAAELVATLMKSAIKHRVVRTRPHVVEDGGVYHMAPGEDRSSHMSSFPSGHTAGAVAVALAISHDYPRARTCAIAAAAAIAAVQIPRCKHFVSDIGAGAIVGAAAAGVVLLGEEMARRAVPRVTARRRSARS